MADRPTDSTSGSDENQPLDSVSPPTYSLTSATSKEPFDGWPKTRAAASQLLEEVESAELQRGLQPRSAPLVRLAGANPNESGTERG
jgi:hypothetical protein